jgi:hypothetical protein
MGKMSGVEHHHIELNGVVSHAPIPIEASKAFGAEFRELLPKKVLIPADNDLLAFEVTSQWAELVAKYVIGIASALSGDLDYAELLYREVSERIASIKSDLPVFGKLKQRLPFRIAELYEVRAIRAYESWALNNQPAEIEGLGRFLSNIDLEKYSTPAVLNLSAFHAFMSGRGVGPALEFLNRVAASHRDSVWHLNVAFLVAYDGDLKLAVRHYRKAAEQRMVPDLIAKIEDFVYFIATSEPAKYQLYFCLAFFNWKVKGDKLLAAKYFRTFLKLRKNDDFAKGAVLAEGWLQEIKSKR